MFLVYRHCLDMSKASAHILHIEKLHEIDGDKMPFNRKLSLGKLIILNNNYLLQQRCSKANIYLGLLNGTVLS